MNWYHVVLKVARGACMDIGRVIMMELQAAGRLDAALKAEQIADSGLDNDHEYTHATQVDTIPWGEAASMSAAA